MTGIIIMSSCSFYDTHYDVPVLNSQCLFLHFFYERNYTCIHIVMATSLIILYNLCTCYLCHTQAGVTALLISSLKGHSAVVRLLLGAGARDIPDKVFNVALMHTLL